MSQSPTESTSENKSYLDAFISLSSKIREGDSFSGRERNCAFLNTGTGPFADVSAVTGFGLPSDSRALAMTDWDRDGDLDVMLTNRTAPRFKLLRNDLADGNHWIALHLEGDPSRNCPRDAMGARVEVIGDTGAMRRITRTLHAGDAFLSQSTSWLVIGLGKMDSIERIDVRWPGGKVESFPGLEIDARYHLKQGTGSAVRDELPKLAIEAGAIEIPAPSDNARIRLSQPLQIKDWKYKTAEGVEKEIGEQATLINLWASSCEPCAIELKEWGMARQRFADAKLEVIALNMESLEAEKAASFLKKTSFAMPWGYPANGLIDTINQLIRQSIYNHQELPAPTSLLIDKGGWLCAIYKGPVSVDQVLKDRAKIGVSPEVAAREALHYPGRWATDSFQKHPVAVALSYIEGGYLDDADKSLQKFLEENEVPPRTDKVRNGQIADVLFYLGETAILKKDPASAASYYRKALQHHPFNIPVLNNLAWLLATTKVGTVRNGTDAVKHAEFMLKAPGLSNNSDSLATLAAAYAAAGRFGDAVATTEKILQLLESKGLSDSPKAETHRERLKIFESNGALSL